MRTALIVFAIAFVAFACLFLQMSILWDADSYYHLAVARHYATHGLLTPIPWARFSMLANGADKELLFHILLMPFATSTGGRIALALLNAALFALIGNLCSRAVGTIGYAIPLTIWIAAPPFFARAVRLRPELLALLLILFAIRASAKQLGILAFLFTLSYTAWHVFFALCVLFLWRIGASPVRSSADRGQARAPILHGITYPLLGTLAGLLILPHPIANLQLWFTQNVLFFFDKSHLDVGNEILPPSPRIVIACLGWLVFLALTLRKRREHDPVAIAALIPAIVFTLLFLGMARMSTYFFPLATVALILLFERSRFLPIAIAVGTLIGIPLTADPTFLRILAGGRIAEHDWSSFGKRVLPNAKIAATWGDAEVYAFYAPQGRYLNVLDPIFMARPHAREYAIQRALFDGTHPDLVAAARDLDSDYIAFDWTTAPRDFVARAKSDPRLHPVYIGYNVLLHVIPDTNVTFTTAPPQCTTFNRLVEGPSTLSFAPYGPGAIALDEKVIAASKGTKAILARAIPLQIPPGSHRLAIRTCPANGYNGFYLTNIGFAAQGE
jgi:hypothetical protein